MSNQGGDSVHILIADDSEEMRRLLRSNLQDEYTVTTVADGVECWEYLDENGAEPPDLVLLDLKMPGLDGHRVLDRMRDDERFDAVDVVMLTALDRETEVIRALEAGATDFLRKPIALKELKTRIDRILQ